MTTELLTEREGATLIITLSGPATKNILSNQVIAAGIETLNMAESNADVRGIVITGAHGHFCSGADFQHGLTPRTDLVAQAAQCDLFNQWIEAIRSFPKPVVAAVEGVALGRGLALALACDLIVAADTARLCAHPGQHAVMPDGGITHALHKVVGRSRAMQILWQTTPFTSTQWLNWGLIQDIAPTGSARQKALEWLNQINGIPSELLASIKELVNDAGEASWPALLKAEKHHAMIQLSRGLVPAQMTE